MDDDWDLNALVRSCTGTTTTAGSDSDLRGFDFCYRFEDLVAVPDPLNETRASFAGDLHELYKPFFPKSCSPPTDALMASSVSSLSRNSLCFSRDAPEPSARAPATAKNSQVNRSKRRKNLVKKVKHVDADELSSDVWSWRKYGQKPIKGSPYPRGYYRCSSSKGCLARKQVERNRSDPGKFIVTYTGEHNHPIPTHRNSLAGSSRRKLPASPGKPSCSSPSTSAEEELKIESGNELEELMEEEGEEGEFGLSDMTVSDDFFAGLEELAGPVSVDSFPGSFTLPWAATAGGGL